MYVFMFGYLSSISDASVLTYSMASASSVPASGGRFMVILIAATCPRFETNNPVKMGSPITILRISFIRSCVKSAYSSTRESTIKSSS